MKLKFIGSSDSAGIPVVNCSCNICKDYRKRNKKNLSTCAFLEVDNSYILFDAGDDSINTFFDLKELKAIFLTHFHADHCMGLLRLRYSAIALECYHPSDQNGFSDLFKHKHSIEYKELKAFEEIKIGDITVTALPLLHSKNCFGYFIKSNNTTIAYLTDASSLPSSTLEFLKEKDLDYTFIDACYDERKNSGNHLNYLQASAILDEIETKNGYLMHISHETMQYIENKRIKLKYRYVIDDEEFNF
ncbi:MBL fold metallo-hydrolase [Halarcobacter ebronensis]|uniref:MBL fold metallo-hydrolase n=1 Tax=Halarcobacter ebronensis TaxID=1462615 RepID=UPI00155D8F5B|nr:MBL fold metallo-hydrolase [Halarcobacter ebronensis]QKF81947.1 5-phospho-alpha-D-ribosyl 1,2-cyclic phosphate phosphodiesterase [Halarcobacter ebronensis]